MEDQPVLWKSESNSMVTAMVGRVMNSLLSSRPKKLEDAIVRLGEAPQKPLAVSMEESLRFLNKYVKDAVDTKQELDEILLPMIENSLRSKESKHPNQAMVLLNWLFQDETLFAPIAKDLTNIILRRKDRYVALGWCRLVRSLVDYETKMTQFLKHGLRSNYQALLKVLSSSIKHLSDIVHNGSVLQDKFELPTRLSVAAADCILTLTAALTKTSQGSGDSSEKGAYRPNASNKPISFLEQELEQKNMSPAFSNNIDGGLLLWEHLDQLIVLVQKLHAWSQRSRALHAKGLGQVLRWLHKIKSSAEDEAGSQLQTTGVLLLASCWRHYSMLSLLEDTEFSQHCDELVEQYLSGFQFYTEDNAKDHVENRYSYTETRNFFLNCLTLLLGRLDPKRLESTMSVYGLRISRVLLSQLQCADEDVTDGAVCIFRYAIFKINGSSLNNPREMEALLPPLLDLLDECDGAARAVIVLIAEYCSISPDYWCLQEVLKRLASGSVSQRRNAADVIYELIRISLNSTEVACSSLWQDIANQLLECLRDEESSIRAQASSLLPLIDPSLVLPALVRFICSEDGHMRSPASNVLLEVLKTNSQNFEVIRMVLDSFSNLCQTSDHPQGSGGLKEDASKFDPDRVFKLIPEWSKTVQEWNLLVGPLIDKMLSEPSNATIVRFLSSINEHLADAADLFLGRLLVRVQEQEEIIKSIDAGRTNENNKSDSVGNTVFDRLCPLLIIKILPLRVFNNLYCRTMYCETTSQCVALDAGNFDINNYDCVASFLFYRAFCQHEYEDVRKLAAELSGRLHPQVLFPVILSQLRRAAEIKDILNMKACLFAICTSLAIRGWDSASHPDIIRIIRILQAILLLPSVDGDEVAKAQHGCIDTLALMICAELQASKSIRDSLSDNSLAIVQDASVKQSTGNPILRSSVLAYVIESLINEKVEADISSGLVDDTPSNTSNPISFRLCMANVLISTCQKISESGKKTFARKTLPRLIHSIEVITNAEIRASCVQVLFSAAYHLKSQIVPYANDLLRVSLESLRKESEPERMAGARLMASLMGSEDRVVENISMKLVEATSLLLTISKSDPSPQLRQICHKLLVCFTSQ